MAKYDIVSEKEEYQTLFEEILDRSLLRDDCELAVCERSPEAIGLKPKKGKYSGANLSITTESCSIDIERLERRYFFGLMREVVWQMAGIYEWGAGLLDAAITGEKLRTKVVITDKRFLRKVKKLYAKALRETEKNREQLMTNMSENSIGVLHNKLVDSINNMREILNPKKEKKHDRRDNKRRKHA